MPVLPLLALAALAQTAPAPKIVAPRIVPPRIVGVSMFKNGYAFVTREIPLTGTTADVIEVPPASVGTLWFTTDGGALESVTSALDLMETQVTNPLNGFGEILKANVGREATALIKGSAGGEEPRGTYTGKIVAAAEATFVLENPTGRVVLPVAAIFSLIGKGPDFKVSKTDTETGERRYYRIATSGGAKRVMMMALERGLTWAPAYALDITDPKALTFVARSTVLNDAFDLKDVDAKLITGFPNLPYRQILDPISANLSIDQWLGLLGGGEMAKPVSRARESLMTQNAAAPMADAPGANWSSIPENAGDGESLGDLFFYNIPKLTLAKGARQSRNLFRFESPYEHVYTWDLAAEYDPYNYQFRPVPREADEVWHTVAFTNTSPQPLTMAVATVVQKSQIVGQAMLSYIAPGAKAEVRIGKALDLAPERLEEETARERGAIKDRNGNAQLDLLTVKGTLVVTNRRREAAKLRVTKEVVGEIVATSPLAKVTKSPGGLGQQNPTGKAVWTPTVAPGAKVTLTYSYRVYVRS